ncbi:MAG: TIGR02300 family protein [Defluviicoccus sp.]|nr:TIGR02300 family protein [Defluviicoccus sp.]
MAKPEWGLKRTCQDCGKRFYDFRRDPIVCPGCQAAFDPLAMLRPRRVRVSAAVAPPAPAKPAAGRQTPEIEGEEEHAAGVADVEDGEIDDDVIDTQDDDGMIKETSDPDEDDEEDDDFSGVMSGGR